MTVLARVRIPRQRPAMRTLPRTRVFALSVTFLLALICCETPPASSQSDFAQSYSTSRAAALEPTTVNIEADLVVRPDSISVPIAVSSSADDETKAISLVEAATASVKAAVGDAVTLRIDDIDVRVERASGSTGLRSSVKLQGVVELELPNGDVFMRAKKVAALHRALAEQVTPPHAKDNDKAPIAHIVVGEAEPGVRDVEAHRPALLKAWSERARAIAAAAVREGADLELAGCIPPAQVVVVVPGTLEKVGLSLPVSCTFTVKKP